MGGWQVFSIFGLWLGVGLAFWLGLMLTGVSFEPVASARRTTRTGVDRRRFPRPGSVDRRKPVPVY